MPFVTAMGPSLKLWFLLALTLRVIQTAPSTSSRSTPWPMTTDYKTPSDVHPLPDISKVGMETSYGDDISDPTQQQLQPERRRTHISDFTNPHTGHNPFLDLVEGTSASTSRTISDDRDPVVMPETRDPRQPTRHVLDIHVPSHSGNPSPRSALPEDEVVKLYPEESHSLPQQDGSVIGPAEPEPTGDIRDITQGNSFDPIEEESDNKRNYPFIEEGSNRRIHLDLDEAVEPPVGVRRVWAPSEPVEGESGGRRQPFEPEEGRFRGRLPFLDEPTRQPDGDNTSSDRGNYPTRMTFDDLIPDIEAVEPSEEKFVETSVSEFKFSTELSKQWTSPSNYFEDHEGPIDPNYVEFIPTSTQETAPASSSSAIIIGATLAAVSVVTFGIVLIFCTWRQRTKRLARRVSQFLEEVECSPSVESKSGKNSSTVTKVRSNGVTKQ